MRLKQLFAVAGITCLLVFSGAMQFLAWCVDSRENWTTIAWADSGISRSGHEVRSTGDCPDCPQPQGNGTYREPVPKKGKKMGKNPNDVLKVQ